LSNIPLISVVMSSFNDEDTITAAINSILSQTENRFEFLIIDDNSNDNSYEILLKFARSDQRIVLLPRFSSNVGLAKCLNFAISKCNTQFIARMDADDISHPKRLHEEFNFLKSHPEIDVVGSNAILIDKQGSSIGVTNLPTTHSDIEKSIFRQCPFVHPSVMFRLSFIENAGFYDPSLKKKQDYDLWFRTYKFSKFANIAKPLLDYRVKKYKPLKTDLYGFYIRALNSYRQKMIVKGIFWAVVILSLNLLKRFGYKARSISKDG